MSPIANRAETCSGKIYGEVKKTWERRLFFLPD
jgi:hypothetical protein